MKLPSHIRAFLQSHDTLTLATTGPDGRPHAAAVFYALDESDRLLFLSAQTSRHSQNIVHTAQVAGTVQADGQRWSEIRGVQLEGTARLLEEAGEVAAGATAYLARFSFLLEFKSLLQSHSSPANGLTGIHRALQDSRLYELRPRWVRMIDNTRGFGHKEEYPTQ